ncbi:hypothetical protein OU798_07505 [Prolixibacteraceae bacterium Z1-6]|uniref:Uncharacterized protein n=1 Tax=Draconibacterium aestuarii TaxID=2998507 RepID=A0A9X3F498_9BACT|nr:hypothetical protein [Prolixibacteraceae bacterium Z1-6]
MEQFKKKHPEDYADPYVNVISDIDASIRRFTKREGNPPNYILINTADYEHLAQAWRATGVISDKGTELTIIQSARLIRTNDIQQGYYDVVCG